MTVTNVTEALPSGAGNFSLESRGYMREFLVETDSFDDNAITVINAPGLPSFYEIFDKGNDSDPQAFVVAIDPKRLTKNPLFWRVIYQYDVMRADDGGGVPSGELTIETVLPQFNITERYEDTPRTKAYQMYWEGDPVPPLKVPADPLDTEIRNSAGDLFSDQPMKRTTIRVITVQRNFRRYGDLIAADIGSEDTINSAPWWGIPAGELRCLGLPGGVRQADSFGTYWAADQVFEWKKKGWWEVMDNVGFNELVDDGADELRRRIQDANKQFITEPVFLDKDGHQLAPDGARVDPMYFQIYPAIDFATILPALPPIDVSF